MACYLTLIMIKLLVDLGEKLMPSIFTYKFIVFNSCLTYSEKNCVKLSSFVYNHMKEVSDNMFTVHVVILTHYSFKISKFYTLFIHC